MKIVKTPKSTWMCAVTLGCILLFLTAGAGQANLLLSGTQTYSFVLVPTTGPADNVNLSVDVVQTGSVVDFTFNNISTVNCSIAQLYFDDKAGLLSGITGINSSFSDVLFEQGATPSNLPGGNNLTSKFNTNFSVSADSPAPRNGLKEGQSLTIQFGLPNSTEDIQAALKDGDLRIGMHVLSIAPTNNSAAFVTPEPVTIALLGLSAILIRSSGRNRSRNSKS